MGFLQLMRPANIVTSVADVLAGIAISGIWWMEDMGQGVLGTALLLCLSTIGLYGGGIVFNDVFDAKLDAVERPERPIPAGVVPLWQATILGTLLLLSGVICAFLVHETAGVLASGIALAALVYNKWSKHHPVAGPLNMGLCRGLNLLLGVSIFLPALNTWWFVALVPIAYIAAITMISRGEVRGGNKGVLYGAGALYAGVILTIFIISLQQGTVLFTILILLAFAAMIFSKLIRAIQNPLPQNIGKAVRAGVIALIIMNAAWASAFGAVALAFIILLLLPLSLWLARLFAVT